MKWTLYEGDCFDYLPLIEDGSVDMILCDLPYGTTACKWDTPLPLEEFGIELLQYTGLKDRQGVEIYEGDIIEDKGMGKGQIVWDNAIVGYAAKLIPEPYDLFKWWCLDDCSKNDMKVIGNVYENPELLEAGE